MAVYVLSLIISLDVSYEIKSLAGAIQNKKELNEIIYKLIGKISFITFWNKKLHSKFSFIGSNIKQKQVGGIVSVDKKKSGKSTNTCTFFTYIILHVK